MQNANKTEFARTFFHLKNKQANDNSRVYRPKNIAVPGDADLRDEIARLLDFSRVYGFDVGAARASVRNKKISTPFAIAWRDSGKSILTILIAAANWW